MKDQIIQAAKGWLGTPYHHQARVKGVGVDCAQLVAAIAEELKIIPQGTAIPFDYSPEWHIHNREELLVKNLEAFGCPEKETAEPGDILCFKFGRAIGHLGILVSESEFIHARIDVGSVVLNSLFADMASKKGFWAERHVRTFSFPGA